MGPDGCETNPKRALRSDAQALELFYFELHDQGGAEALTWTNAQFRDLANDGVVDRRERRTRSRQEDLRPACFASAGLRREIS
jgi:hypothetical protein